MIQGGMNSETYIRAPFIHPREVPQTIRKKPSMFLRLLKKRSVIGEERTKFTVDTGFYKLNDDIPDFSEAQSSVETRQGEDDAADAVEMGDYFREYHEVYSNLTYLSTLDDLTVDPFSVAVAPSAAAAPSLAPSIGPSLGRSAQPPSEPSSPCPASVHVPVVYSWDPNQPMEDTRLEPIHAVVSEYSRTLNDAFFGEHESEEEAGDDGLFEQQVQRRGKFRRALRGLKRK